MGGTSTELMGSPVQTCLIRTLLDHIFYMCTGHRMPIGELLEPNMVYKK